MSEHVFETDDMSALDTVADIQKISQITVAIYLYNIKVYDYVLEREMIETYNNEIPLAPSDQIDFMKDLCRSISDNGGVYKIVTTIISDDE